MRGSYVCLPGPLSVLLSQSRSSRFSLECLSRELFLKPWTAPDAPAALPWQVAACACLQQHPSCLRLLVRQDSPLGAQARAGLCSAPRVCQVQDTAAESQSSSDTKREKTWNQPKCPSTATWVTLDVFRRGNTLQHERERAAGPSNNTASLQDTRREEAGDSRAGPSDSLTGSPVTRGGASSSSEPGALLVCIALPPEPQRGSLGRGPR